ncbi:MAG: M13 family metallopeptidase [Candidatus Phosphoribacter sp.]
MTSGILRDHLDLSVRPQDDLFRFTNGTWVAQTEIPADRGRYGTFDRLREAAEHDLRAILDEVTAAGPDPSTPAGKVAALYGAFLDEARVESRGLGPVAQLLADVDALGDTAELPSLLGRLDRLGLASAFGAYVNTDDRDSDRYVPYVDQGGLGLPDESYYREERYADVRAAYEKHVAAMLTLAGRPDPQAAAARILALETRLAASHIDKVADRDAVATYHLVTRDELSALAPSLDWGRYAAAAAVSDDALAQVVVRQPGFLQGLSAALADEPIQTWREWLAWHVLHSSAPLLPAAYVQENFDFYGRILAGTPALRERWKRGVELVDRLLGEALGELYVERHFPPAAKARMSLLVENLVVAFQRSFADRPWMGEATKGQAMEKLATFVPKIGYPDTWRDYSALVLTGDLLEDVWAAKAFEHDRALAKLGGPVDRGEWFMTPQTVNAYYNPGMNEIVFPAAILQPPFFDVAADDAVNYGGIGGVIGHEIGHGFDDQGSQYDRAGNLRNWWTDEDRAAFDALSGKLIAQFDRLEPIAAPGRTINGALTVGENLGDLAGLGVGHAAYRIACEGQQQPPVLDGLTGDQRFFVGWAQVWCGKAREETAIMLLAVDPHSPAEHRANIVRNVDAFHEAFGVQPGDGMWLAPEDRVSVF